MSKPRRFRLRKITTRIGKDGKVRIIQGGRVACIVSDFRAVDAWVAGARQAAAEINASRGITS